MPDSPPVLSVIQQSPEGKESPMMRWMIHQPAAGGLICSVSLQTDGGFPTLGVLIPAILEIAIIRRGQRLILEVS